MSGKLDDCALLVRSIILDNKGVAMPIDEYACSDCGHEFEALVHSSTDPECPNSIGPGGCA